MIGEPAPQIISVFPLLGFLIVLLAFGVNHFLSNSHYWREESY
jgi:hypothetical protein